MSKLRVAVCIVAVVVLVAGLCGAQGEKLFPVSGRVLMPDGAPSAGALVEARCIGNRTDDWTVKGTATTGADGAFTMQLEEGSYRTCAVSGEYIYLDRSEMIDVNADGSLSKPIKMCLEKGCRVEGSVVDTSSGQPVGGVKILSQEGDHAESSDSGEWSMVVCKRRHAITVVKEGYWWPIVNFDASGDTAKVKVEIKPGGTIRGRVVDEQGQPIPGAWVGTPGIYFRTQAADTDADGRFVLAGQDPDSKISVSVGANGYDCLYDQPVTFPSGQKEVQVDFTLTKVKVRTISGRVTNEDGSPVEGAQVAYGYGTSFRDYVTARTDEDGRYTIEDARIIGEVTVVASGSGLAPVYKTAEADKDLQMDFQMKPGHTVEGRVEDEDGNPLAGAQVSVSMELKGAGARDNLYERIAGAGTDKDGRFKLENLPEGFVYVNVYTEDYDSISNERLKVDRKDYTLVLRKTVLGHICGTVVKESDGKPVTEFNVRLDYSRRARSSGLPPGLLEQGVDFHSEDGKFSIKGLAVNGGRRVVVTAPGYMWGSADPVMVKPESEEAYKDTVIRLHPAKPFEGCITEAGTGSPVEGALVTVWGIWGTGSRVSSASLVDWDVSGTSLKSVSTHTGAGGKFRFEAMPFFSGTMMLEKPGLARTLLRAVISSRPLQASMEKGATVAGTVADEQGNVPPGVWLSLENVGLNLRFRAQINPDGSFKVEDLPSGEYVVLQYNKRGLSDKYRFFDLKAGETHQVDWAKQGPIPVVVEGKVLQNGRPVPNAGINVNTRRKGMDRDRAGSAVTGEDGSYRLAFFKPGEYFFSCTVGGGTGPNGKTVQLAEGANQVDFDLPYGSISGKLVDKLGGPLADASVKLYTRETYEQYTGGATLYWMEAEPRWWPRNECKTDKDGAFQAKNLKAGEWMICAAEPVMLPAAVVKLAEGEAKTGVIAKVPPTGSAKFSVVGMKSMPEDARIACVDECGMVYSSKYDGKTFSAEFPDLPVGKLRAVVVSRDYLPAQVLFQALPNKTANVSVKLTKGSKIVFQPKGDSFDPNDLALASVAFRITTPDGKPVLQKAGGLYWWGDVTGGGGAFGPPSIVIKPGTYLLKAAIRVDSYSWGDESDLTGYSGIIKVAAGKDTVVEIPWEQ